MPVSDPHGIPAIMNEVARLNPVDVIELGVGFGKWGVLVREILDARHGRLTRGSWNTVILGVEVFSNYRNPCWDLYTQVVERNFIGFPTVNWDLVMMIDSLEHLSPEVGRPFLKQLVANNKRVIVSVPNGRMDQGDTFGNPFEAHRWTFEGLDEFWWLYDFTVLHRGVCTVVSIKGGKQT